MGSQEVLGQDTDPSLLPQRSISLNRALKILQKKRGAFLKLVKEGKIGVSINHYGCYSFNERDVVKLKKEWLLKEDNSVKIRFDKMVERVDELEAKVEHLMYINNIEELSISVKDLLWYYDEACDFDDSNLFQRTYDYVVNWIGFLNRLTLSDMHQIVVTCHDNTPVFPFIYASYFLVNCLKNMRAKKFINLDDYRKSMADAKETQKYLKVLERNCENNIKTRITMNRYRGGSSDTLKHEFVYLKNRVNYTKTQGKDRKNQTLKKRMSLLFEKIPQKTTDS